MQTVIDVVAMKAFSVTAWPKIGVSVDLGKTAWQNIPKDEFFLQAMHRSVGSIEGTWANYNSVNLWYLYAGFKLSKLNHAKCLALRGINWTSVPPKLPSANL